jgi:choice-of-anchor C domain-containing protein
VRCLLAALLWVGGLVALPPLSVSAQSLIVNGSFEQATVNPGAGFIRLGDGDTRVTGWVTVGRSIDYIGDTYWPASDGVRSFDLDGAAGDTAALQQTFATTPGKVYVVTFDMAGNPDNLPTIKPMRVSADGQSADFSFDITGRSHANMGWSPRTWSFVADDASATLELRSMTTVETGRGWGPAVDNVVIVASLPVPALGAHGLALLAALLTAAVVLLSARRGFAARRP